MMLRNSKTADESIEEEKEQFCETCLRRLPSDVTVCPSCSSAPQAVTDFATSKLLTVAGTTAAFASILTLLGGFAGIGIVVLFEQYDPVTFQLFTVLTLLNFIGFVLSCLVTINTSTKKGYRPTINATILLSLIGPLNLTVLFYPLEFYEFNVFWAFMFGGLVTLFALLSLISVAFRRWEFKEQRIYREQPIVV